MLKSKLFSFDKLCNFTNYFKFFEDYLKANRILKKDFFHDTGLNAGTYRNFLKNTTRNTDYFYEIISRNKKIYLPDTDKMKALNEEFMTYFTDLLYLKHERLKTDLDKMTFYIHPTIESMEEIPFVLLDAIIRISIEKYNYEEQKTFVVEVMNKLQWYRDILSDEFEILFCILEFIHVSVHGGNVIQQGNLLKQMCKDVEFINGFVLNLISFSMYQKDDYLNAILYAIEACDSFYKQNNYIRLIYTRSNLGNYYLLAKDYPRAYQIFYELSFLSDLLDEISVECIEVGLFDTLVLLEEYENALNIYKTKNLVKYKRASLDICFLYVCYQTEKDFDFMQIYQNLLAEWNKHTLYEPYYHVMKLIYGIRNNRLRKKQIEKTIKMIAKLNNKITKIIFLHFITNFNKIRFYLNNENE